MLTAMDLANWRLDSQKLVYKAEQSLSSPLISITEHRAEKSEGTPNDFYSNGDYWWPNPESEDGLPYVRRDGESYPEAFLAHRMALRSMRTHVANLVTGYVLTQREDMASKALELLRTFFIKPTTRMNPHMLYAQAIPGVCSGRGIGIIDTLHLK